MKGKHPLSFLLILFLTFGPNVIWAQDGFDFGDEDEEVEETEESEEEESDPEEMSFESTEEEGEAQNYADEGPQNVAVAALPGPDADPERRAELQKEMERYAATVPNVTVIEGSAIIPQLEQRGLEDCVVEPICLAEVGSAAGVDRVLMGRVKSDDAGLELALDYFDVEDRLFIKYHSAKGLSGTDALVSAVEPGLKDIFEVREVVDGPNTVGPEDAGPVQTILAWSTAGLAVISLGLGIYFGISASGDNSDLEDSPRNSEGVYEITQREADDQLREVQSTATTANIFYGLAAGLAVASVLLFYIQGGSDVATEEELAEKKIHNFRIAPAVTPKAVGVGAGFSF